MAFTVRFRESNQKFVTRFKESNHVFTPRFGQVNTITEYVGGSPYEGSYLVTPKIEAQVLPTAKKYLENDVTIKEIPFFEVSNTSGGNTVYIGNEV